MTVPLRERRRIETAREIQRATLRLATERGLDNVTTDAIAEAAGVSPRTFFNYYTNKEAASVGLPPPFSEEARAGLRAGTGPLPDDLKRFLDRHLDDLSGDEDIIRALGPIIHENGKVRSLLDQHLRSLRADLAGCLEARLPGASDALRMELADWALQAIGNAIDLWLGRPGQKLRRTLDEVWAAKLEAAKLVAGA
ncbi:TetR/AcrR family transcriptional regulator [Mangrovicoccus ximenensis]|uniref:TetR/AcrR family transcriptional regulator n=1 Tax=Mangrovicoccus ximenensis TaxID=1911570 RepID=UPI000D3DAD1D|nr:TetR/AcrR family transcriptional regulator [Mangrovicoccus ximenensis]